LYEDTYQCAVDAQSASAVSGCPPNVYCIAGNCFDTSYVNDPDFARSMSYMEAGREAGVYLDTDHMQVFKGEDNRCRDRLLKDCCDSDSRGGGMSNQSVFGGTASRLVFDILMNADNRQFIVQGVQALLLGGGFAGTFSTYGVTIAVNGAAIPSGSVALFSSSGGGLTIAVDPFTLAVAVIIYAVLSLMSCNKNEAILAMKEGANLCHRVGSYCSSCIRVFGRCVTCIERTTSKCCFNSVLSRVVNEQGRAQIGKSWGGAQDPDCSGFTIAQLQTLNFAAMDLTEFYASIVPKLPNVGTLQTNNANRTMTCYFGKGKC
jgi:conjugal transfer mating pair stabilization protein TraN